MSSTKINPIDIFFSKGNVNAIYETIQAHIKSKYNKDIGREYLNEILEIMKLVVKPLPKRLEKNKIDVKRFVTTLNKQTLKEALPLFEKSVSSSSSSSEYPIVQPTHSNQLAMQPNNTLITPQSQQPQSQYLQSQQYPQTAGMTPEQIQQVQYLLQSQQLQQRAPNMQGMSLPGSIPQPSYGGSNDDNTRQLQELDALYDQLFQERGQGNGFGQKPPTIDFTKMGDVPQVTDPRFNTSVDNLYEQQQNYRQNGSDVMIPPPNIYQLQQLQQRPFQVTENFQVSPQPLYQPTDNNVDNHQMTLPNHSRQFYPPQNNINANQVPMNIPMRAGIEGGMSTSIQDIRRKDTLSSSSSSQKQISVDSIYNGDTHIQNNSIRPLSFEEAFAPEQFNQFAPRIDRNVSYPVQSHDFSQVVIGMNGPLGIAPQPQQMRVLIPKTSRNTTVADRSTTIPVNISIDSRNRDPTQSDSSYRISIDEIRDVLSIELTDAQIPISEYVINESNNIIYFEETNGSLLTAEIIPGNYSPVDLAAEIETQMNSVGSSTYTVAVDSLQNRFIFNSDGSGGSGIFNLMFDGGTEPIGFERERPVYIERSIGTVIGFAPEDQTGSLMYSGKFTYNLKGEKYILLYIKEAELIKTRDSNVKNAFAKIVLDQPLGDTKYYNRNIDNRFIKYFSPPIGRLAQLTIEFRKQNGDLYNFNGQNNSLSFEVITKDLTTPIYQDGISVTNV